jgi:hypothetical protein
MIIQPEIIQALSTRLSEIYAGASFDFNIVHTNELGLTR